MKTESIRDVLQFRYNKDDDFSEEEFNQIDKIVINRFDISKNIIDVDYNDILFFKNLKSLIINDCIIDDTLINNILCIPSIDSIFLYNCEFIVDDKTLLEINNITNLLISNTNIDLVNLNCHVFNHLTLENVNIDDNLIVYTNKLDVKKCKITNWSFLECNINTLIVSYDQYYNNKNIFDNYIRHFIVMEKNNSVIHKEVNTSWQN